MIVFKAKKFIKLENSTSKITGLAASAIATETTASSAKKIRSEIKNCDTPEVKTDSCTNTTTSCTSSTDSGVNSSDNEITIPPSAPPLPNSLDQTTVKPFNKEFHKKYNNNNTNPDKNVNKSNNFSDDDCVNYTEDVNYYDDNSANFDNELKNGQHRQQQQLPQQFIPYQSNKNAIKGEKVLNFAHKLKSTVPTINIPTNNKTPPFQQNECITPKQLSTSPSLSVSTSSSLSLSSTVSYEGGHLPSKMHNRSSPAVSIRSIDSSIIYSDSDSDLDENIEGVHEDYVIKKLGTQVSYPPKHPDIPNIKQGQKILNQQVTLDEGPQSSSPLEALARIGDYIGAAQSLRPFNSTANQRPHIGSIALNNSTDVTFGDKHFYEGPVTIQQFLIDSRDKRKENNENDNPTFVNDTTDSPNNAKDINTSSSVKSIKLCGYICKHKKLLIPGTLAIMALLVVALIFGTKALNDSKSKLVVGISEESRITIPINSTIDTNINVVVGYECFGNGTLCLVERDIWQAHPQKSVLDKQQLPLHRAIISHTASESCDSFKICAQLVRVIQEFHMNSLEWDDIGYNFLISSDGLVYVGRGWDAVGAHTKGYNYDSVGITFIGTYMTIPPTEAQLKACILLLEEGVRLKKLTTNYRVYGARQFAATESPGDMLYKKIKQFEHWSADINL